MANVDDLITPLRVVCVSTDMAIDRVETPIEEYIETRDEGLVVALPGRRLRWATVGALSLDDFMVVDSYPPGAQKLRAAFMNSVRSIENYDEHGDALRPSRPFQKADGTERFIWTLDELRRIFLRLGAHFIYELGYLAHERAMVEKTEGGCVYYTRPPSLQHGLEQIARQHAAQSRMSDGTPPNARSA